MLIRLAILTAAIVLLMPDVASAAKRARQELPADIPTLFVSKDVMAIRNGQQKITVRLSDALVSLETPYGKRGLEVSIWSPSDWVRPTGVIEAPKTYRSKDLVTAVVTLAVPDDRRMVLRISAYPGVPGVFVKSGVSGLYGGYSDYYFWSWDGPVQSYCVPGSNGAEEKAAPAGDRCFDRSDWFLLPQESGGLVVLTNGIVGCREGKPFIQALPRWRFLRPNETLDVCFGLAGVANAADAAAVSKAARDSSIDILKPAVPATNASIDYGTPAPEWLRSAGVSGGWYGKLTEDTVGWHTQHSPIAVRVPADKEVIAKAHEAGVRAIVHVNYSELCNSEVQKELGRQPSRTDEATPAGLLDLAEHPEWTCIASDGTERQCAHAVGVSSTCFHQAELRNNALTQVLNIMNLGADGIWIDRAGPPLECYGPRFDKHKHEGPYDTNTAASEALYSQIYKLVKSFGEDKIVIHSSGILPSHWAYCDAQVCEGLPFHPVSDDGPIGEWAELQCFAAEREAAIRAGKVAMIVPRMMHRSTTRAILYSHAYAALHGLLFCLPTATVGTDITGDSVERLRLGKPESGILKTGDVLYRFFANGIVVLNPTRIPASVSVPVDRDGTFSNIGYNRTVTSSNRSLALDLAPESGCVLLRR